MNKFKTGQLVKLEYDAHLSGINGRPIKRGKHSGKVARITGEPADPSGRYRAKIVSTSTYVNFRECNFRIVQNPEKGFYKKPKDTYKSIIPASKAPAPVEPKLGLWSRILKSIFG